MMTERRWSPFSQWLSLSPPPAYRGRYEIKLVLKPSVPCGASSHARAVTTNARPAGHEALDALRGINQRLPCGAMSDA